MAFIGIDVGTSGCKVCAFSAEGVLLNAASRSYTEKRGDGTREIDPNAVRAGVLDALAEAALHCPEPAQAVAVTCLGESLVFLDGQERVLCGSMVTGDNRGGAEAELICGRYGADRVFDTTGLMPGQLYSLPKLVWMKEHTDVISRVKKVFFYEDYIGYLLTGERKVSFSSAARSMAFDINRLMWDAGLLALAGLAPEQFSEPVPTGSVVGRISAEMAGRCHLPAGIPVIAGAHDQVCAALGSGLLDPSMAVDGIGTCECLAFLLPDAFDSGVLKKLDMPRMIYPPGGRLFTTLEVTTCGAMMNWCRDVLLRGTKLECAAGNDNFFRYMDSRVTGLRTEVLMLPQLGSSGHPDLNLNHRTATITGLTLDTTEEDLFLAAKESTVYQLRLAYECAAPLPLGFEKLVMAGGAATSDVSARIRADVFNRPVYTLANNEAGALGCMMISAAAVGVYPDIASCARETVRYAREYLPDPQGVREQEEKYQRFKDLYEKMH